VDFLSYCFKKIVLLIFIPTLLFLAIFIATNYYFINQTNQLTSSLILTINPGTSFNKFSQQLVEQGIVKHRFWVRNFVRIHQNYAKIRAGSYQINADMTLKELLVKVTKGKEHQFNITFVEGSTLKQWIEQLNKHPNINHSLSETLSASLYKNIAHQLSLPIENPEGLFFPDTYAFINQTKDIDILRRAYDKMQLELNQAWAERAVNLPYNTPYQALIMASIIEKESGQFAEHRLISSVFVNRLEKGMRLQTDPTVIYGLGERYQGNITRAHLREKTVYNTYRINGLPPTPIAMAGKSALTAALQPANTDYYYFVSNGQGKHVFSRNLADHNKAVVKYQLK
jgi:UPF0755 protein